MTELREAAQPPSRGGWGIVLAAGLTYEPDGSAFFRCRYDDRLLRVHRNGYATVRESLELHAEHGIARYKLCPKCRTVWTIWGRP